MNGEEPLPRGFFERHALDVAPELIGKILEHGGRAGRIVEVEAYDGENDAASHAYRGRTARNATMFGPGGLLYVYFTYGMHFCANVVCRDEGAAGAVLLRALAPLRGVAEMRAATAAAARRPKPAQPDDSQLCSGPARLCRSLGIDRSFDGSDLVRGDKGVRLLEDGWSRHGVVTGPRVGLSERVGEAAAWPWRFYLDGDRYVSGRRGRAKAAGALT